MLSLASTRGSSTAVACTRSHWSPSKAQISIFGFFAICLETSLLLFQSGCIACPHEMDSPKRTHSRLVAFHRRQVICSLLREIVDFLHGPSPSLILGINRINLYTVGADCVKRDTLSPRMFRAAQPSPSGAAIQVSCNPGPAPGSAYTSVRPLLGGETPSQSLCGGTTCLPAIYPHLSAPTGLREALPRHPPG